MIKYKVESNGRATNLQVCSDDYVAHKNETVIEGDRLPDIETLHSKAYLDAQALVKYKLDRQAEYPTIAELTIALYDDSDKSALVAKRNAVKLKYPKPS